MEKLIEQLVKEIAVKNKLTAMQMINKNPEYFADLTLFPGYCSVITHKVVVHSENRHYPCFLYKAVAAYMMAIV